MTIINFIKYCDCLFCLWINYLN